MSREKLMDFDSIYLEYYSKHFYSFQIKILF